ncbi:MAG: bifunctional glutamate N-acetyltransferase/amino-acid acetyltransferase ArgJ [Candidatus Omnitrophica bacterium]|nr:bifunctional glutamate N-acetyltransferase/amino-acid acetyltransferase ArgJ [Candidatus Omnitrophota bacterium]
MRIYKKAILPIAFKANGAACGIRKLNRLDLALFYSSLPARASCQFTTNKIPAAPIQVNKEHLKKNKFFQAIIVNSGNANCFTGSLGLEDAAKLSKDLARALGIKKEGVLVASTGIIAKRLPAQKISKAIPGLIAGLSLKGIHKAKLAIMTTDAFAKEIAVKCNIGKKTITICGVAKGAGMIAPDMATMLCFILTDANITQGALNKALGMAVKNSFNCITVDGCMSTNDSVMVLANAAAGNALIARGKNYNLFTGALELICLELAKMIVKDAEGASKFIQIKVKRAKNYQEAKKAALSIANSNLFKAAIYGENPNFGRIVASLGASGAEVKEKDLKIKVSPLNKKEVNVEVSINRGNSSATVYTSDLTPEYIKINAEYS